MAWESPEPQENKPESPPEAKPTPASKAPSGKGKNIAIVAIVVLVILVVFVAIWFTLKATSTTQTTTPATTQSEDVPEIKSDADLEKLENELKNTDVDDLGTGLDENDKDSSEF